MGLGCEVKVNSIPRGSVGLGCKVRVSLIPSGPVGLGCEVKVNSIWGFFENVLVSPKILDYRSPAWPNPSSSLKSNHLSSLPLPHHTHRTL